MKKSKIIICIFCISCIVSLSSCQALSGGQQTSLANTTENPLAQTSTTATATTAPSHAVFPSAKELAGMFNVKEEDFIKKYPVTKKNDEFYACDQWGLEFVFSDGYLDNINAYAPFRFKGVHMGMNLEEAMRVLGNTTIGRKEYEPGKFDESPYGAPMFFITYNFENCRYFFYSFGETNSDMFLNIAPESNFGG